MKVFKWMAACMAAALMAMPAYAQKADPQAEWNAAVDAAMAAAKKGPADIALKDQATLKLPENHLFVPQPQADQLMKAMGNGADSTRLGLIYPVGEHNWFVVVRHIDSGHINDEEAREWKADKMLEDLKQGTETRNKERAERGIPAMEIVGWVQKPTYDAGTHRLVWSVESKDKGQDSTPDNTINYNTYVLGREGFITLNLVTTMKDVEKDKVSANALLADTTFNNGKSYGDFNASTDRIAEYGIGALVAGVAAKKLGLFAVMAAFVAKFFKLIIVAGLGLLAGIKKYFQRKKEKMTPAAGVDGGAA